MDAACAVYGRTTDRTDDPFGAVPPERRRGAALLLPAGNTEAIQLHLDEIAAKVSPGAHAVLILDQAAFVRRPLLRLRVPDLRRLPASRVIRTYLRLDL